MSNLIAHTTEGEEAVAAATVETLVQARGVTTAKFELAEIQVSSDFATDFSGDVYWELLYQTTDGTATGATEIAADPDDPTPQLTGFHSFSAEPTAGNIVANGHFNCNGGEATRYWAEGDGFVLDSATSSRIGIRATSDKACNMVASMRWRVKSA